MSTAGKKSESGENEICIHTYLATSSLIGRTLYGKQCRLQLLVFRVTS